MRKDEKEAGGERKRDAPPPRPRPPRPRQKQSMGCVGMGPTRSKGVRDYKYNRDIYYHLVMMYLK